ncbi:hypothetical protein HYH03_004958 [Edaphochlamys debaryana]|uniref:Uncharacterized protein n=1 Tax=Edaphochlamys debaryana TaxID=47281 RepID=A0A835Y5Y5_9CHLO|nr:hypothetical protein HYH03_004958 [Edaphochlamys debaryana]|eukprot:KAG2496952.1 hypothetical protein HYH03_004958 [Edaphochlamys debaryana]
MSTNAASSPDVEAVPLGFEGLRVRPMRPHEHLQVLEVDADIYATPHPVTLPTLREWCAQVPEVCFVLEAPDGRVLGLTALIPLHPASFALLTAGRLREAEVCGAHVYDVRQHDEIAIHFSLMKKIEPYPKGAPDFGLAGLYGIAHALRKVQARREELGWPGPLRLCGMSGLGVSPEGIRLTVIMYSSRERSYICPEHVLREPKRPGGGRRRLELHTLHAQEQLEALLGAGYELVARCRLLVLLPDEPSFVWTIVPRVLGPEGGGGAGERAVEQRGPAGAAAVGDGRAVRSQALAPRL